MRRAVTALAVIVGLSLASAAQAATAVVAPATLGTWQTFIVDSAGAQIPNADGGAMFVNGPPGQPSGLGSVRLVTATGHGDGGAQLRNTGFAGTPLSSIKALSYATFVTQTNGSQVPYLRLTLDLDGNGSPDDEIIFEPVYQSGELAGSVAQSTIQLGAWQLWNARAGRWWALHGLAGSAPGTNVKTIDELLVAAPQARIINTAGGAGGISFSSGVVAKEQRFDGNVDVFTIDTGAGPTTYDFEPGPPPPAVGTSAVINAVQGTIQVTVPGKMKRRLRRAGENVPVGTIIDATRGRAALTMAVNRRGKTERTVFFDGKFSVKQNRGTKPITDITLRSLEFAKVCGGAQSASAGQAARATAAVGGLIAQSAATRRSKRVVTRLWGDGKGRFRTKGRNSAATVRGTRWLTEERCDGTLTRVARGVVQVKDTNTGKTVTLTAGRSYLASRD
ncbi:MAG: hypothetical protein H0W96_06560 [Solirubrobacterales bacterium]|nr:hypothetical protein [Solirubrobacterales bacterium]